MSPLRRRGAPLGGGGRQPAWQLCFGLKEGIGAVGKWETCFWFSTFPSAFVVGAVGNVGISPAFGEISKGLWKEGKACFWLSTLSMAPAFPQLSFRHGFGFGQKRRSFALALIFRLLIFLGMLHPITRDVQLDDHTVMH